MGLALAVLGTWNWVLRPDRAAHWLPGILLVPAVWLGVTLLARLFAGPARALGPTEKAAVRRYANAAMVLVLVAGGPMLVRYALGIWAARFGSVDPGVGRRMVAFSLGAMLVVVGNMMPKILTPLFMLPPGRAGRQQEARRFLGLAAVLLGLTIAAAAILAPLDLLAVVGPSALVIGALAWVAAVVWMNVAPSQPEGRS